MDNYASLPMITFVTHFQKIKDEEKEKIFSISKEFTEVDGDIYINSLYASCCLFHKEIRFIVLTDMDSQFLLHPDIELKRLPLSNFKLRFSETMAQMIFLQNFKEKGPVILIDFDMLVQDNLDSLFNQGVDLYLTVRKYPPWIPINMGVTFINEGKAARAGVFFEAILSSMLSMPEEMQVWGGSQLAVWHLIKEQYFLLTPLHKHIVVQGVHIGLLNAEVYNFSTESIEMSGYYPEKKLLHFKGSRKRYQPLYFENYLKESKN